MHRPDRARLWHRVARPRASPPAYSAEPRPAFAAMANLEEPLRLVVEFAFLRSR
jgi:hypothetical protein